MSNLVTIPTSSVVVAVSTGAAVTFSTTMPTAKSTGQFFYSLTCTVACWYTQAATTPVAVAATGSGYAPAGVPVLIDPNLGVKVSVLGTASGSACLAPMLRD